MAEVWIDGKRVGTKAGFAPATVIVPMPASEGERIVTVLLESNGTQPSGLGASYS